MNEWYKQRVVEMPCNTYNGKYGKWLYYTEIEEKKYKKRDPDPVTRFHDADCLFKHLVDYCIDNNYTNSDGSPIVNSNSKREFLKLVYDNSKK